MKTTRLAMGVLAAMLAAMLAGCSTSPDVSGPQWKPIGNRKARVVHWGIIHNHSSGKWDAVLKLTNDYEMVGWVDDTASTAMRMVEPSKDRYSKYPCFTPRQVFEEVKPDLIVVEVSNSELVEVSTEIARHGIPMHMDKPLGADLAGFRRMSAICEARGVPLQIDYGNGSMGNMGTHVLFFPEGGRFADLPIPDADTLESEERRIIAESLGAVRGAPGEIRTDLDFSVPLAKTLMLANMVVFAGKGTYAFDGTKTGHAAADAHARHAYRKGWEVA